MGCVNLSDIIKTDNKVIIQVGSKGLPNPFERDIYLFTTHIAGTGYVENKEEIIENTNIEDEVTFIRESNNIYDKYAICVKNKKLEKLGYIPKKDNIVFARLMDAGKLLIGKIVEIEELGYWNKIKINIYLKDL